MAWHGMAWHGMAWHGMALHHYIAMHYIHSMSLHCHIIIVIMHIINNGQGNANNMKRYIISIIITSSIEDERFLLIYQ
jgi:hypothetical protein